MRWATVVVLSTVAVASGCGGRTSSFAPENNASSTPLCEAPFEGGILLVVPLVDGGCDAIGLVADPYPPGVNACPLPGGGGIGSILVDDGGACPDAAQ